MNRSLIFSLVFFAINAFSAIQLPPGGSAEINGQIVTCSGNANNLGALTCSCNGTYGVLGEVVVSGVLSPVDECSKLSSGSAPRECRSLTSSSGYYKCDCNGTYGTLGQVIIHSGKSAVEECRKLSSGATPRNCLGI